MRLELLDEPGILRADEVDSCTLAAESPGSSDSVDVLFFSLRKFVVDDQLHLLDIDSSGKDIGGDQDSDCTCSELLHNDISLSLVHFSVHAANHVLSFSHTFSKLFHTLFSIAKDDALVDAQIAVEVLKTVKFPVFALTSHVILVNASQSELLILDQNLYRIVHEALSQL